MVNSKQACYCAYQPAEALTATGCQPAEALTTTTSSNNALSTQLALIIFTYSNNLNYTQRSRLADTTNSINNSNNSNV